MKILVTGAQGFIAKNLIAELTNQGYGGDILAFDRNSAMEELRDYASSCDFVFHLAGVNRPKEEKEFAQGNTILTQRLMSFLAQAGNSAPVLMTSSVQAMLDNPYGRSKRSGEEEVFSHCEKTGARALVYRLPNVYGKWCRPNYNSAVATFCHNTANGLPIQVNDRSVTMRLVYIDDVIREFISAMQGGGTKLSDCCIQGSKAEGRCDVRKASSEEALFPEDGERFMGVSPIYEASLGTVADIITGFPGMRSSLTVPDMSDGLIRSLYATYLSYLPTDSFAYDLDMRCDDRGSFTEFLRDRGAGQVSVNVARPGITKGQHWHHSKNEKFLVVRGEGLIRFRRIDSREITEYRVSGSHLRVVDIPTGYTHSIVNVGDEDMVTVMWASEPFDPDRPDTYYMEV